MVALEVNTLIYQEIQDFGGGLNCLDSKQVI
jgi:hypothetical protein